MGNDKIRSYYEQMAAKISDPRETRNKAPDFSPFDIAYVRKYAHPDHDLLELGAGTGLLLNPIQNEFRSVLAVELHPRFSQFIKPSPQTIIVNQDILEFETSRTFDLILLFGIMNYFSHQEASSIYKKAYRFTKPGGKIIVKNAMGIEGDVLVDHFSTELQQNYFSEYRAVTTETALLKAAGFDIVQTDDIYPDNFNRWQNTRYMAIVGKKH